MPMYEYGCQECAHRFDRLRRMGEDDSGIVCPHCGSSRVQRQFSVFAALSKEQSGAAPAVAATAGGGCCGACGSCTSRN